MVGGQSCKQNNSYLVLQRSELIRFQLGRIPGDSPRPLLVVADKQWPSSWLDRRLATSAQRERLVSRFVMGPDWSVVCCVGWADIEKRPPPTIGAHFQWPSNRSG